jgi:hypothetical protein
MRTSTKLILTGLSGFLVLLTVFGFRHGKPVTDRGPSADAPLPSRRAPKPADWRHVDGDLNDPRYREWLEDLRQTVIAEDDLFKVMRADLSPAQKNAAFQKFMRGRDAAGSLTSDPARWSRELQELLRLGYVDNDLAVRVGTVLRYVATPGDRVVLEGHYQTDKATLTEGARSAIIATSSSAEFLRGVVGDRAETVPVREAAIGRMAVVGERAELARVLRDAPETLGSGLAASVIAALGETASDEAQLREAVSLAAGLPEDDDTGRRPVDVARVGIAESPVHGKAVILFEAWRDGLT